MRAAAQLRGRLGEDREARGAGQVRERLAQLGVELAAGDDHAGDRVADVPRDLVEQEGRGLEVDRGDRGQRASLASLQRQRVGRRDGALDRDRRQRLAPGQVEVDRPGPRLAARRGQRPAGHRAVVQQAVVVGLVGADFAEPAHRRAVELDLVDRLPGADPAQLGRPVGGQDDQRHARLVRLADRRVVVGRGRAGGAEQRHRRPRRLRGAEREEGRRALVDDHAHLDLRLAPERDRERGRARAGGDHRVPQAAPRQLLDEGRGERGVGVGRVHRPGDYWRLTRPYDGKVAKARSDPVGGKRLLVDLDAEAGPGGRVEHAVAELALDRGDRRGEEALRGEAVGQAGSLAPAACSQRLGDLGGGGDPDRTVERAGDDRRAAPRRSRSPPPGRRPWRA